MDNFYQLGSFHLVQKGKRHYNLPTGFCASRMQHCIGYDKIVAWKVCDNEGSTLLIAWPWYLLAGGSSKTISIVDLLCT